MKFTRHGINEALARRAKEAYSFYDYAENSATNTYLDLLEQFESAVNELIEKDAGNKFPATAEQLELVQYYGEKYSAKLAAAINRENEITARVPSIMITGGSNFPVRKKEKQNAAMDKFWQESGELFDPTHNYYFRKIKNIFANTTIYSNDALAVEKLENKLQDLEELQVRMKEYNAYYRKHKTMKGFDGISDEKAAEMDKAIEESWYKQPCAPFHLTNNNAEIKRIRARIDGLKRLKENAEKPIEDKYPSVEGVEVVENSEAMRVQLRFDGKPDDKTRELLKSNGFRWAPSMGVWQRQLTDNGIRAARRVLKELKGDDNGKEQGSDPASAKAL